MANAKNKWEDEERGVTLYGFREFKVLEQIKLEKLTIKRRQANQDSAVKARKAPKKAITEGEGSASSSVRGGGGGPKAKPLSASAKKAMEKAEKLLKASLEDYDEEMKDFDPVNKAVDKEVPKRHLTFAREQHARNNDLHEVVLKILAEEQFPPEHTQSTIVQGARDMSAGLETLTEKIRSFRSD